MQAVWEKFQEEQHFVNTPPDTQWYQTLSLSILWKEISPEVRHEEAHIYSHRYVRYNISHIFIKVYTVTISIDSLNYRLLKSVSRYLYDKECPNKNEFTQSPLITSSDHYILVFWHSWINIIFSILPCHFEGIWTEIFEINV